MEKAFSTHPNEKTKGAFFMHLTENDNGTKNSQSIHESTHIIHKNSRSGNQQYIDNGFGKIRNHDFEPLHYADN